MFCPIIRKHAQDVGLNATRIDIEWDTYSDQILNAFTRTQRGQGVRRQVREKGTLPKNWPEFLRNSSNKEELFRLLAESSVRIIGPSGHTVSTLVDEMLFSPVVETKLPRCTHVEADTRLILHTADAVLSGLGCTCSLYVYPIFSHSENRGIVACFWCWQEIQTNTRVQCIS